MVRKVYGSNSRENKVLSQESKEAYWRTRLLWEFQSSGNEGVEQSYVLVVKSYTSWLRWVAGLRW